MGKKRPGRDKGRRGRFRRAADAAEQLNGVRHAQGQRRRKRSKQIIDSIEKSKQRLDHELDRIKDLDDANEQFGP